MDVSCYCNVMGHVDMRNPTKWKHPDIDGKKYILHYDDDYRGPFVEEIRDDGYTTKLKMSKDKFWDFQALLSQMGWVQI